MELLSLVVKGIEQEQKHISVKLDYKDIRNLKKTITVMKSDLSAYPSGDELARIAGYCKSRTLSISWHSGNISEQLHMNISKK